ncbi:hypothetical protein [Sphingomonas sp. ID0503]|uniref:hypothetical protein n=1 Tax=Sphingomonas sp. ID0503 TaxID=3399691 RepID=UPI003AFA0F63
MARLALRIHVSEPWTFERENESADLTGWTADHRFLDKPDWLVHLDKPITIAKEAFGAVQISPRYVGEDFWAVMDNPLVNLTVNIVPHDPERPRDDDRPSPLVGLVAQGFADQPSSRQ